MVLSAASAAHADADFITIRAETVTSRFEAYAQVEPVAVLPLRAMQPGIVGQLEVLPGDPVRAGQTMAELGGPEIQASLTHEEAAASSAKATMDALQQTLAIQRRQLASHLATQQDVLKTEGALAQARSALDTAQAQLQALRQTITLTAPADGIVLAVGAAAGEPVKAGDTIVTLQPSGKLWLEAEYYGSEAARIRVGITGQFVPAGGGAPIPVKVASVFGALNPSGGESVGLFAATPSPGWLNGEFGTVTLNGPARSLVAVPSRALILDRGTWWVLVHTRQGEYRRAVVPGPAQGWQTFIESGLQPGEQVVVENAYLAFHRNISESYRPPD